MKIVHVDDTGAEGLTHENLKKEVSQICLFVYFVVVVVFLKQSRTEHVISGSHASQWADLLGQ